MVAKKDVMSTDIDRKTKRSCKFDCYPRRISMIGNQVNGPTRPGPSNSQIAQCNLFTPKAGLQAHATELGEGINGSNLINW
jgi:hypothetical protein